DLQTGGVREVVEVHSHPCAGLDLPVRVLLDHLDAIDLGHRVGERVALDAARNRDPDVVECLLSLRIAHAVASTGVIDDWSSSRSRVTCAIDSSTGRAPGTFASSPWIEAAAAS